MERRTALKIVALGALAPSLDAAGAPVCGQGPAITWLPEDYAPRFFTAQEMQALDRLMEMIIPADAHSPGAHAAQVNLFADLMVATSGKATREHWRSGLKLMQAEAASTSLAQALAKSAAHEGNPSTPLERFFASLKAMTVNGYYTSAIGIHQDLRYQGNAYVPVFPGCALKSAEPRREETTRS